MRLSCDVASRFYMSQGSRVGTNSSTSVCLERKSITGSRQTWAGHSRGLCRTGTQGRRLLYMAIAQGASRLEPFFQAAGMPLGFSHPGLGCLPGFCSRHLRGLEALRLAAELRHSLLRLQKSIITSEAPNRGLEGARWMHAARARNHERGF